MTVHILKFDLEIDFSVCVCVCVEYLGPLKTVNEYKSNHYDVYLYIYILFAIDC